MRRHAVVLTSLGLLLTLSLALVVLVLSNDSAEAPALDSRATHTDADATKHPEQDSATPKPESTPEREWAKHTAAVTLHGKVAFGRGRLDPIPAEGARVSAEIAPVPADARIRNAAVTDPRIATSDANGEYRLNVTLSWKQPRNGESDALTLVVTAELEGCLPASASVQVADDPEQRCDLLLVRAAAARGRVIDAVTREPIEGARVSISRLSTETGADGTFLLEGLAAGDARLQISAEGYAPADQTALANRLDPHSRSDRLTLRFVRGGVYVNDFGDIVLAPETSVEGRVVHPDTGEPVDEATVYLRKRVEDGWHVVDYDQTDSDGWFWFSRVPPGTYSVLAVERQVGKHILEEVEVPAHTAVDLGDLPLNVGGTLRGRLIDSNGEGVPGFVSIGVEERADDIGVGTETTYIYTGDDGAFEVRGMLPVEYRVMYGTRGGPDTETTFDYPIDSLELRVPQPGTIRGTLVHADGVSPYEGEITCLLLTDELREISGDKPEPLFSEVSFMHAEPTRGGQFEIRSLLPGRYLVAAWSVSTGGIGYAYDIEVRGGEVTETGPIRMLDIGGMRVTVRKDGAPEPAVSVWIHDRSMHRIHYDSTNDGGQLLFQRLRPGQYTVRLEGEGEEALPDSRTVTVRAGETTELEIDIAAEDDTGLELVWTGDSDDAPFLTVIQAEPPHSVVRPAKFGVDNSVRVTQLMSGRYYIVVTTWGASLVQRLGPFEVRLGEVNRVPVSYSDHRVEGRVTVPGDARFWRDAASVSLTDVNFPPVASLFGDHTMRETVRPDGSFEFGHVADGEYVLAASIPGFGHVQRRITISESGLSGIELALPGAEGELCVKVTGPSWHYGAAYKLQLLDALGNDVPLTVNPRLGRGDEIKGLAPGVYTLGLHVRGCLPVVREGVEIRNAEVTLVVLRVEPAGELRLSARNPEITAPRLQRARVTLFDASGARVEPIRHPEDDQSDDDDRSVLPGGYYGFEHAVLRVMNLGPDVERVRVEVPGYEPLDIPYSHAPGTIRRHSVTLTPAE